MEGMILGRNRSLGEQEDDLKLESTDIQESLLCK